MEVWLEWARGPIFRFALGVLLLGLARVIILTGAGMVRAYYRAGDPRLPFRALAVAALQWLFPVKQMRNRLAYSLTSMLFHVGLILTPMFLGAHIMLWERGIGLRWPGMGQHLADSLTLLTVLAGIGLIIGRAAHPVSRALSRFEDFALPPLLLIPFVTGFLAMHQDLHSLSYDGVMLAHALSADLILILIPFTKLAHCVLLPALPIVSELGWRFPTNQGNNVAIALGKEKEPV